MTNISVALDDARAARILGMMAEYLRRFPGEMEKNNIVALNRVGITTRKEARKMLTKRYTADPADIKRKIDVTRANSSKPFVMVHGVGRPIHLGRWPGKPVKLTSENERLADKAAAAEALNQSLTYELASNQDALAARAAESKRLAAEVAALRQALRQSNTTKPPSATG